MLKLGDCSSMMAKENLTANYASMTSNRQVELVAQRGSLNARDALFEAIGHKNSNVKLRAAKDVTIEDSLLHANRRVAVSANDKLFADGADLLACGNVVGHTKIFGRNSVAMSDTTVRGYKEIGVRTQRGPVDLKSADVAIVHGSARGDIKVVGDTIYVEAAAIIGPESMDLSGNRVGTPAQMGHGTRACPA